MDLWITIPALAALLAGGLIFLCCPVLRRFHKFMGFTFIFEGLTSLLNTALLFRDSSFHLHIYLPYIIMLLVIPAFYYLAVQSLLKEYRPHGKDFWMFQTAAVFTVVYIPLVSGVSLSDRDSFLLMFQGQTAFQSAGAMMLNTLDMTAYGLYLAEYLFIQLFCVVNVSRYIKSLENYFSGLEGKSVVYVSVILSLMGLRFVIMAVTAFIPSAGAVRWLPVAQAAVSVLFYAAASYSVCHIRYTAEELGKMAESQAEKMKLPVANDVIDARLSKLVDEKFYLVPDVNLLDVATRINVNSKYVSEYLRFHFGETFMSYVNRLRVESSTEFLNDKDMTMEEIANRAGYTNASTYYRNFTKIMGMSPSKYRESAH